MKESVIVFLREIISNLQVPIEDVVIVLDNHGAHKSHLVRDFVAEQNLRLLFLPSYSSVLNPIERVWSWTKRDFASSMARIKI